MKITTTYGRSDIAKQKLELSVIAVNLSGTEQTRVHQSGYAVTAQFNGNNTHRTIRLYSEKGADGLMKGIAEYVKENEFPWEDRLGSRLWKQLATHTLPF